jgi:hypothetical protein
MFRSIVAVVIGVIVMALFVGGIEFIGHMLWPLPALPAGVDPNHPEVIAANIDRMPFLALAWVLFAYAVGTFFGAGTATSISAKHKRGVAIAVGVVVLCMSAAVFSMFPHPLWMVVGGLLVPLPFALLGWRVFR